MKNKIYAIYDDKAEAFNAPFPLASDGLAQRAFLEGCKDARTDLYKFPGDFSLYNIATWDDTKGQFENIIPPKFICKNLEIKKNVISEELDKIEEEIKEEEVK